MKIDLLMVGIGLGLFVSVTVVRIVLKLKKRNYDWTRAAQLIAILVAVAGIMIRTP